MSGTMLGAVTNRALDKNRCNSCPLVAYLLVGGMIADDTVLVRVLLLDLNNTDQVIYDEKEFIS